MYTTTSYLKTLFNIVEARNFLFFFSFDVWAKSVQHPQNWFTHFCIVTQSRVMFLENAQIFKSMELALKYSGTLL